MKKFMGKAVVALTAVGLAAGSVIGAGAASAVEANGSGLFGAIAFSEQQWYYGSSVDAVSAEEAITEALGNCAWDGASDCAVLVTWADGCGALIYIDNDDNFYGVGTGAGPDRSAALFAAHASLGSAYPRALLANVGSADWSNTGVTEVICTANV
ncbi:DUF4189 domain-containing protein [Nocardia sp. NPDC050712]|uniref:DUF4189 domain-containing protein n=1 Tax=Nocardia sp. NPDC050712 TaxID=3155518 RepID=UPI0033D3F167